VTVQPGYQFRRSAESDPTGDACLIQLSDVSEGGEYYPTDLLRVKSESIPKKYHIDLDDLLLPSRGDYSFAVIVKSKPKTLIAGGYFYILKVNKQELNPTYLCWFLNSRRFQGRLSVHKRGTSMPSLERSGVKNIQIPVPSLAVQKMIAEVYRLSREEVRLMTRLQELKTTYVQERLLGHINSFV
jgi:restriction endonuclease S subunit